MLDGIEKEPPVTIRTGFIATLVLLRCRLVPMTFTASTPTITSTPWMQPEKWDGSAPAPRRDPAHSSDVRTASGAPGPGYWQQQVDYDIDVTLDADRHRLIGSEDITYYNNSPQVPQYLWVHHQTASRTARPHAESRPIWAARSPPLAQGHPGPQGVRAGSRSCGSWMPPDVRCRM